MRGPQGFTGATGMQGMTGMQGETGPQGPTGPQGFLGSTGPQGTTGLQGNPGHTGHQGPTGPQGATGLQGPTGYIGSTGQQGSTGSPGPTGYQGPTGFQGSTGPQGATGPSYSNFIQFSSYQSTGFTGGYNTTSIMVSLINPYDLTLTSTTGMAYVVGNQNILKVENYRPSATATVPFTVFGVNANSTNVFAVGVGSGNAYFAVTDPNLNSLNVLSLNDVGTHDNGETSVLLDKSRVFTPTQSTIAVYQNGTVSNLPSQSTVFPRLHAEDSQLYSLSSNSTGIYQTVYSTTGLFQISTLSLGVTGEIFNFLVKNGISYVATSNSLIINNQQEVLANYPVSESSLIPNAFTYDSVTSKILLSMNVTGNVYVSSLSGSTIGYNQIDVGVNFPTSLISDNYGNLHCPYYGVYHYLTGTTNSSFGLATNYQASLNGYNRTISKYDPVNNQIWLTTNYQPALNNTGPSETLNVFQVLPNIQPSLVNQIPIGYDWARLVSGATNVYFVDNESSFMVISEVNLNTTQIQLQAPLSNLNRPVTFFSGIQYNGSSVNDTVIASIYSGQEGCVNIYDGNQNNALFFPGNPASLQSVVVSSSGRVYFDYTNTESYLGYSDPPYQTFQFIANVSGPATGGLCYAGQEDGNDVIYVYNGTASSIQRFIGTTMDYLNIIPNSSQGLSVGLTYSDKYQLLYYLNSSSVSYSYLGLTEQIVGGLNSSPFPIILNPYTQQLFISGNKNLVISGTATQGNTGTFSSSYYPFVAFIPNGDYYSLATTNLTKYSLYNGQVINSISVPNGNETISLGSISDTIFVVLPTETFVATPFETSAVSSLNVGSFSALFSVSIPAGTTFQSSNGSILLSVNFNTSLPSTTTIDSVGCFDNIVCINSLGIISSYYLADLLGTNSSSLVTVSGVIYSSQNLTVITTTSLNFLVVYH
jgi:hypothetical protein